MVPAEPDPEVAIGGRELLDELYDEALLALGLDAEELAAFGPAGSAGLGEG